MAVVLPGSWRGPAVVWCPQGDDVVALAEQLGLGVLEDPEHLGIRGAAGQPA